MVASKLRVLHLLSHWAWVVNNLKLSQISLDPVVKAAYGLVFLIEAPNPKCSLHLLKLYS